MKTFGGNMEFWGFESTAELPGEGFGLFALPTVTQCPVGTEGALSSDGDAFCFAEGAVEGDEPVAVLETPDAPDASVTAITAADYATKKATFAAVPGEDDTFYDPATKAFYTKAGSGNYEPVRDDKKIEELTSEMSSAPTPAADLTVAKVDGDASYKKVQGQPDLRFKAGNFYKKNVHGGTYDKVAADPSWKLVASAPPPPKPVAPPPPPAKPAATTSSDEIPARRVSLSKEDKKDFNAIFESYGIHASDPSKAIEALKAEQAKTKAEVDALELQKKDGLLSAEDDKKLTAANTKLSRIGSDLDDAGEILDTASSEKEAKRSGRHNEAEAFLKSNSFQAGACPPPGGQFASFASGPGGTGFSAGSYGGSGSYGVSMGTNSFDGSTSFGLDLSNNQFSIGFTSGSDARSKGPQLDAMINQLLAAIMQGNTDAIASAITLCNLKAKTTLIGASLNMVRAMQLYDRQMKKTSDDIGQLAGKTQVDGGARLAQLNSEMNGYSLTRQAISNSVRDIMGMIEEMSNLETSIYTKKDREAQFYRWA